MSGMILRRWARPLLGRAARAHSSTAAADPTDEVLAYVRGGQAVPADTAVDVLTSSLSRTSSSLPLASARLYLALAEVEASRGAWRAAADAAGAAAEAAAGSDGSAARSIQAAALDARVRACLTAGWDEEAATAAAGSAAAGGGDSPLTSTSAAGWAALVAHAAGDAPGAAATAGRLSTLLDSQPAPGDPDAALATAWAAVRAGAVAASVSGSSGSGSGSGGASLPPPSRLFAAAASAASASQASADLTTCPTGPHARGDLAAAVSAATAQLALAALDFDGAEDAAAAALDAQTAVGGGGGGGGGGAPVPRPPAAAAAPLLLLGDAFARRAQLTVAEGLYKRAAQGAGLVEPTGGGDGGRLWAAGPSGPAVHPSLASTVAWRLAQLLTLAPRRTTEADRWAGAAVRAGGLAGDGAAAALAAALGPLDGLKGGVVARMAAAGPCWVDVSTRRVFPRLG